MKYGLLLLGLFFVKPTYGDFVDAINRDLKVSIDMKNVYDSRANQSSLIDKLDINSSSMNIELSNSELANTQKALKNYIRNSIGQDKYHRIKFIYQAKVSFSATPSLLEGRVLNLLDHSVKQKINEGIAAKVDAALKPLNLPEPQRLQMRTKLIADAKVLYKDQIAQIYDENMDKMRDRVRQIKKETTLQEFVFGFGGIFDIDGNEANNAGEAMLFVRVGKLRVSQGLQILDNGRTELENTIAGGNPVQNAGGTANTGAVQMTYAQHLGNGIYAQADAYLFSNRIPFVSAQQYVADIATMDDAQYDSQKSFWKINSQLLRLMLSSPRVTIYGFIGNYDGKVGGGAGARIQATPKDSIHIDLYLGDRKDPVMKKGVSAFVVHSEKLLEGKYLNRVELYLGQIYVNGQKDLTKSTDSFSYAEESLGASFVLFEGTLINLPNQSHIIGLMRATIEGFHRDTFGTRDSRLKDHTTGVRAGTVLELKLQPPQGPTMSEEERAKAFGPRVETMIDRDGPQN